MGGGDEVISTTQTRGFSGNPKVEHLRFFDSNRPIPLSFYDGRHGVLMEDLTYVDKNGKSHTAKAGLIFDGGSIPRFFWQVIEDPWGQWLSSYVIHDWYCRAVSAKATNGKELEEWEIVADALFDEMLEFLGAPKWKRYWMVKAVRWYHTAT